MDLSRKQILRVMIDRCEPTAMSIIAETSYGFSRERRQIRRAAVKHAANENTAKIETAIVNEHGVQRTRHWNIDCDRAFATKIE